MGPGPTNTTPGRTFATRWPPAPPRQQLRGALGLTVRTQIVVTAWLDVDAGTTFGDSFVVAGAPYRSMYSVGTDSRLQYEARDGEIVATDDGLPSCINPLAITRAALGGGNSPDPRVALPAINATGTANVIEFGSPLLAQPAAEQVQPLYYVADCTDSELLAALEQGTIDEATATIVAAFPDTYADKVLVVSATATCGSVVVAPEISSNDAAFTAAAAAAVESAVAEGTFVVSAGGTEYTAGGAPSSEGLGSAATALIAIASIFGTLVVLLIFGAIRMPSPTEEPYLHPQSYAGKLAATGSIEV